MVRKRRSISKSIPPLLLLLLLLQLCRLSSSTIVSSFRVQGTLLLDRTTSTIYHNNNNNFIVRHRNLAIGKMSTAGTTTPRAMSGSSEDSINDDGNSNKVNDDTASTKLPRIDGSVSVGKTKWLELRTCDYTDQEGAARKWDYATRTTKQSSTAADAVVIIPLLTRYKKNDISEEDNSPQQNDVAATDDDDVFDTILVEQFRPPIGRATFEFPAGLIDTDESPEQAALRELREETGYIGEACRTVPKVSRPVCMSPGLCDETVHVVVVMVDLDNPYNQKDVVAAQPDAGEYITIHRVSMKDGLQTLLDKGESPMAIQGLYLFALGLELGKTLK
jgi:8-oxo-dGTP pyrophosphatase MutT (NUDIX family)